LRAGARPECAISDVGNSFDDLVGELLELHWHIETQRFGGLEVDHQLELDWGLDGKLARFLALEDAIDVGRRSPKIVGQANAEDSRPPTSAKER
jgi:hypothetical protein